MKTNRLGSALALVCALGFGGLGGCQAKPIGHPSRNVGPEQHTRRDLELTAEQQTYLDELARAADEAPEDFEALRRSGLAHMNFALSGVLSLQDRAERDLEAAFALDPSDRVLARSLGRFYNMRAVDGDYSKADMQVRVYAALLGAEPDDPDTIPDPLTMGDEDFVAYSFFMLGRILTDKNRGNNLQALAKVKTLERQLAARVAAQPEVIEFRALAGNFAFFFAGNIPVERERRVREAVAYFEVLRARWDELRPGARHPSHCPNTRENFMFELAEGLLVLERGSEAEAIYRELSTLRAPRTRAKERIAQVAEDRLAHLAEYSGDMRLMPPWPSDVGNCVVCHAWSSEVGLESLYTLAPLEALPSQAETKPIGTTLNVDEDWTPTGTDPKAKPEPGPTIAERERLPAELASLVEARCAPCHFAGGEVVDMLDLSTAAVVERRAKAIRKRVVDDGDMPPDGLGADERVLVQSWFESLPVE